MVTSNEPLPNLLFEYRGADIILRSHDVHHFRVPKVYIVNCSPVLEESIQKTLDLSHDVHGEASLPVIQLPESGAILHSLLTFIFPVTALVPSTIEKAMELLSVAQKYQMDSVLAHIRFSVAQQNLRSSQLDSAVRIYSLAQKYGLRQEALQAARTILKYPMDIETLEDDLDVVSSASLYELWKYCEKVRTVLVSDLTEFRTSGAHGTLTGLRCKESTPSQIPCWIDDYIKSIGGDISLFDFIEFNSALTRHMEAEGGNPRCECVLIPSETIREFWEALESVVDGSFKKVSLLDVESCI
jgi:BTB/POZ domain